MNVWRSFAILLSLGLGAVAAHADGGAVILHRDAGPWTVTLFAAPQPLTVGAADLSVMVQDRQTGNVLLDPAIDVIATPQGAGEIAAGTAPIRLAPARTGNRLVQSAVVPFAKPGHWQLTVRVRRGAEEAQVTAGCSVEPDTARAGIVWFYVLLPIGLILLFLWQQRLKGTRVYPEAP